MALNVQQAISHRPQFGEGRGDPTGVDEQGEGIGATREPGKRRRFQFATKSGDVGPRLIKVPWPMAAARSHRGSE